MSYFFINQKHLLAIRLAEWAFDINRSRHSLVCNICSLVVVLNWGQRYDSQHISFYVWDMISYRTNISKKASSSAFLSTKFVAGVLISPAPSEYFFLHFLTH